MFSQLHPILKECKTIALTLKLDQQDDSKMIVVMAPQHPNSDKYPALNQPIMVSGTPEELDAEYVEQILQLSPVYIDVSQTVTTALQELEKAKKEAKKPAQSPTGKASAQSAQAKSGKPNAGAAKVPASPVAAQAPLSIFDNTDIGSTSDAVTSTPEETTVPDGDDDALIDGESPETPSTGGNEPIANAPSDALQHQAENDEISLFTKL